MAITCEANRNRCINPFFVVKTLRVSENYTQYKTCRQSIMVKTLYRRISVWEFKEILYELQLVIVLSKETYVLWKHVLSGN